MRYWWVNQNQTYGQEVGGGYLWSPKRKSGGQRNYFYDTMREVAPGDLVFSFCGQLIKAIGVARSYAQEALKPAEFGTAGQNWSDIGWRVGVEFLELDRQVKPAAHIDDLRPLMPARYAPLQTSTGRGLQGVYLTELPDALALALMHLIGDEAQAIHAAATDEQQPWDGDGLHESVEEYDRQAEDAVAADESRPTTERRELVLARRGAGVFRRRVLEREHSCRITHVDNPIYLFAGHLKPWRACSDEERLDGENGLALTPSIHHLFQSGFISFKDSGDLIVAPVAHGDSLRRIGVPVDSDFNAGEFSAVQRGYLEFHRDEVLRRIRTA